MPLDLFVVGSRDPRGARSRRVYLPAGDWYDFSTEERVAGGREIERDVDLETMPLYLRAGAVIPIGPVKHYADERVGEPLTLLVCPAASDTSYLYDDDGISFHHREGELTRLAFDWDDAGRSLTIRFVPRHPLAVDHAAQLRRAHRRQRNDPNGSVRW